MGGRMFVSATHRKTVTILRMRGRIGSHQGFPPDRHDETRRTGRIPS